MGDILGYARVSTGDQDVAGLCCKHGARPRGVTQLGD